MKRYICLLLAMLLLLAGCREEEQLVVDPSITESLVMEVPKLNHGVLEYEKLKVEPWYCGRMEFTSGNTWAETEKGYYYYDSQDKILKYADKSDLSKWVPVCSKPHCQHTMYIRGCNALLDGNTFLIKDGRIYYGTGTGGTDEILYLKDGSTRVIASRALDGTDLRLEYYIDDAIMPAGGSEIDMLTAEFWLLNITIFNPDGTYINRSFRRTDDTLELVAETTTQEMKQYFVGGYTMLDGIILETCNGDTTFSNLLLSEVRGDPPFSLYRYVDDTLERVEIEDYIFSHTARYLSGNTLRLYRPNDGYYDLDLTTRQETKVADSQLTDAQGGLSLPNCMIESSGDQIVIFNGESWRQVQIPEELRDTKWYTGPVASDRIFLIGYGPDGRTHLSQIMLGKKTLDMEYCGIFG